MAFGQQTFSDVGGAVADIFTGFGDIIKAEGAQLEGQAYTQAAQLARLNAQYTEESTAIQEAQSNRELNLSLGRTQAQVAGAGFSLSGSALDILRSSAAQGSLQKAVIGQQGLITEAGYREQAQSYDLMASAANKAASGEQMASIGSFIGAGLDAVAAIATLL